MEQKVLKVGNFEIGNRLPLVLISGPCQIESRQHAIDMCGALIEITKELGINYVYKSSFDKANRSSIKGARGIGLEKGMEVFDELKKLYNNIPILTDIHTEEQCAIVAPHVDILQIPAFLSRQTDLSIAAAKTGKVINIKKGQFSAPWDMPYLVDKIVQSGNDKVCLTDRGTSFGYNTLITDMTAFPTMAKETGCPTIFDATHSVQKPGGLGGASGGNRDMAPILARAAVAAGVAAIFVETHECPEKALSDGPNSLRLSDMKRIVTELMAYDKITKSMVHDYY